MDLEPETPMGSADEADVVAHLRHIEARLIAAFVEGDPSFHEEVLAGDWATIDVAGRMLTKAQVLEESFAPVAGREITSGKIDQVNVRLFGGWAIVTGRTRVEGQQDGEDFDVSLRFTDVFALTGGRWMVVASQGTLMGG